MTAGSNSGVAMASSSTTNGSGTAGSGSGVGGGGGGSSTRRHFTILGRRFHLDAQNVLDVFLTCCTLAMEKIVLILGPLLIIFASVIISGLTWTFFTIVLPMLKHYYLTNPDFHGASPSITSHVCVMAHVVFVIFILTQIIFNYFMCVTTSNKGKNNDIVVRELAVATKFVYPESPQAIEAFRRDYEDKMLIRIRRRQARAEAVNTATTATMTTTTTQDEEQPTVAGTSSASSSSSTEEITSPQQQLQAPLATTASNGANITGTTNGVTGMDGVAASSTAAVPAAATTSTTTTGMTQRKTAAKHKKVTTTTNMSTSKQGSRKVITNVTNSKKKMPLPTPKQVRNWMLMGPDEWGYCQRSKQPKPPRAHYDHVTKALVLCLDHYCPWMFNTIGYFNYRYFCSFLWFVTIAMFYGAAVTYTPFRNSRGPLYTSQKQEFLKTGVWKHLYPMVPIASERMPISMAFMLCLAVGCAVACLGIFHLYLCVTAQTTIEFHGNWVNKRKAKQLGNKKWKNPYDLGMKRNWQQIFGSQKSWWLSLIILSTREPEFLPLPILGEEGKRRKYRKISSSSSSNNKSSTATLLLSSSSSNNNNNNIDEAIMKKNTTTTTSSSMMGAEIV